MGIISGLLATPATKVLAAALGASLIANGVAILYTRALRAEAIAARNGLEVAVAANETNQSAIQASTDALAECVGKKNALAQATEAAIAARDRAEQAAAAARARRARDVRAALTDPDCAANSKIPVCPGLVGAR